MNKEQQIEEMATFIHGRRDKNGSEKTAKVLFEAGYRKVPKGSFICSADGTNLDVEICNNCEMKQANELFERDKEIERLKAENKRLSVKLGQILLSIDTVKEMNAMCNIGEQRKQAVEEFVLKIESLFAYYDDKDTFSKKVILDRVGETLKECEK